MSCWKDLTHCVSVSAFLVECHRGKWCEFHHIRARQQKSPLLEGNRSLAVLLRWLLRRFFLPVIVLLLEGIIKICSTKIMSPESPGVTLIHPTSLHISHHRLTCSSSPLVPPSVFSMPSKCLKDHGQTKCHPASKVSLVQRIWGVCVCAFLILTVKNHEKPHETTSNNTMYLKRFRSQPATRRQKVQIQSRQETQNHSILFLCFC